MVLVAASSSAASAASGMLEKSLILEWALEKLCTAAAATLAHTIRHLGRRRTRLFIVSLVITSGSSTPTPSAL